MDRCEVPELGARLFAKKASFLGGLRHLDIGHNHFRLAGLATLLDRKSKTLHTLRIRDNDVMDEGAELLAKSPASDPLLEVDLSENHLGIDGAQALGAAKRLRELLVLRLADNPINEYEAAALAASPLGRRLAVLELDKLPHT
jgi:Ran GTPase-activating protein (RanGAP) involved in mRNA processing and transport